MLYSYSDGGGDGGEGAGALVVILSMQNIQWTRWNSTNIYMQDK